MKTLVLSILIATVSVFSFNCSAFDLCEGETTFTADHFNLTDMVLIFESELPHEQFASGFFRAVAQLNSGAPGGLEVTFFLSSGDTITKSWSLEPVENHSDWSHHELDGEDLSLIRAADRIEMASGTILTYSSAFTMCKSDEDGGGGGE